ncbi:MAG: hypothetical protein UGF89_04205, partial [Acutalibacteraceae bacterium]|nr:hypothetical protein [Acutalibacteraceae bacterium]
PMLFSDESLSNFIVSLYSGFSETASEMEMIGLDASVSAVANGLGDYPDVQKALLNASSWEEVNLEGVKWGISDKNSFATAFAKALSPFNDIFYTLLCSGTYTISGFIKIEGANGYENAVVPMLQALKCTDLISQEEFTNQATLDRSNMLKNILLPLLAILEDALDAPMDTLTEILPSFAFFIKNGEMDACMDALLSPIFSNPLVEIAAFLKILDLDSMKFDMDEMLTTGLSDMAGESGLQLAPIDMERLSKCGSHNGMEFQSDKGRAFVEILRWLIDSLKLNKTSLPQLMKDMGGNNEGISTDMLSGFLDNDTDAIVGAIILLFTPAKLNAPEMMLYPEIAQTIVQFTPNLTEENYKKVLNEIDDLLDDFVKEGGSYRSIEALLSSRIYTNANINALMTGVYGSFEKEGLSDLLILLGIEATPKGVAHYIKEDYPNAYNALIKAESWEKVSKNISWGFYNGSRRGFQNALLAVLRPLTPLLKVVLAGEDIVIVDAITLKGADGYNTGVIPILEALGCKESSIKTYTQYVSDNSKDALLNNIAEPVFDLLDEIFDNPVKTLTRILPNVVYFLNSGSLEKCLSNLLIPVTALTSRMSGVVNMDLDTSALTKKLDFNKLLGGMLEGSGMKIAEFDINSLAGIGSKTEKQSKSTYNGNFVKYSYIEADQTGVLLTLLRVLAKTLKMPGNENLLVGTMAGGNDTFSTYSASIGEQFAAMTEDELIEWLYNLLFKERAQLEIVVDEDYNPTIIYKEPTKDYTILYIVGGFALVSAVIGIILFCNRKRLYY